VTVIVVVILIFVLVAVVVAAVVVVYFRRRRRSLPRTTPHDLVEVQTRYVLASVASLTYQSERNVVISLWGSCCVVE